VGLQGRLPGAKMGGAGGIIGGSSESLFQTRHQSQNVRVKYLASQMEFFEPGRRCLCHYYIVKAINSALLSTLRYIAAHNGSPKLHYHASDQNCPAPGNHLLNFHNLSGHRGGTTAASESNASKGAKLCEKRYKTTFDNAEHKHQFVTGSWYSRICRWCHSSVIGTLPEGIALKSRCGGSRSGASSSLSGSDAGRRCRQCDQSAAFIMDWIDMQYQLGVSDVSRCAHRRL
jgi:hypothetical protein